MSPLNDWAFVVAFGLAIGVALFLDPAHGAAALAIVAVAGALYL